jgi:hypothetical protein
MNKNSNRLCMQVVSAPAFHLRGPGFDSWSGG